MAFVLLIPPNVFAEYDINDICEWAVFASQTKVPIDRFGIEDGVIPKGEAYSKLLHDNYEDWEIEGGFVPVGVAQSYMIEAQIIQSESKVDIAIEYYNVNPQLKPILITRFLPDTFDERVIERWMVDHMLHPDFYGKNIECEQKYLEENWDVFSNLLIRVYGENAAEVIYDEIEKRVYGDMSDLELTQKYVETTTVLDKDDGSQPVCGKGTIEKNGQCLVDASMRREPEPPAKGGGCLIATATYGSELAPQVQQLRELRDNSLLQTESGSSFMGTFNDFYYSFSPIIADYERENPVFKEMVKMAITPMISSMSLLNYVGMDSESEVLGYGIALIMLNGMVYLGIPVSVIVLVRKF